MFALDEPYTRHGEGYHMKRTTECNSVSIFNPFQGETAGMGQHGIAISQGSRICSEWWSRLRTR